MLIEAGIDTPPHDVTEVVGSGDPEYSCFDPRYHWEDFRVHYRSYAEARAGRDPAFKLGHVIATVHDPPGVGENLRDHPETAIVCHLRPGARIPPKLKRAGFLGLRYSSGHPTCAPGVTVTLSVRPETIALTADEGA